MQTIPLPLSRGLALSGPGLSYFAGVLIVFCQTAWPWRLALACTVILSGALFWRRYLRQRPVSLTIDKDGHLWCMLADGQRLDVERILPGIIRPCLLCCRLKGGAGKRCDLLIPGGSIPQSAHRAVRRAVIGFRPAQPADRRGT
mgnify:CR=1 FL=1